MSAARFTKEIDAALAKGLGDWLAALHPAKSIGVFDVRVDDVDELLTLHLAYDDETNELSHAFDSGSYLGGYHGVIDLRALFESLGLLAPGSRKNRREAEHQDEARTLMDFVVERFKVIVKTSPQLFDGLRVRSPWYFEVGFYSGNDPDVFLTCT